MTRQEFRERVSSLQRRQAAVPCRLLVCQGTPCLAAGAEAVRSALVEEAAGAEGVAIEVIGTGCRGPCSRGPLVTVQRPGAADAVYQRVTPVLARRIVAGWRIGALPAAGHLPADFPFLARQTRRVLANCGQIDPENLDQALAAGGYAALARALHEMSPAEICAEVEASGLRGRGGGGYPTGRKWQLLRAAPGPRKYVVANGDEGDPGAYMDRALMESDPHRILEGMAIAGYATGARRGCLYVRGEYPLAARRLRRAIADARRLGLLGRRILGSSFSFHVEVRLGAGAFVCGEETALMASIMGRRGQPVPRPPYPAERGLWGRPTIINNVETFANIPAIVGGGAAAFAALGTPGSRGTKVFALCGEVVDNGLIEVPMGMPLREIIFGIGGGLRDGTAFKAAQTGGPSGGCIPAAGLDTPMDYENLQALGSIIGSGGLIVIGTKSCVVDLARFFMEFCMEESCGKCSPCRAGTVQMHRLLDRIARGHGSGDDLQRLTDLAGLLKGASLCGLGSAAPNPVLSTLRWFGEEYLAHLREKRCPAGVCRCDGLPAALADDDHLRRLAAGRLAGERF